LSNNNSPNLVLLSSAISRRSGSTNEAPVTSCGEDSEEAALCLLEARDSAAENLSKIVEYVTRVRKLSAHGTVIQLSQDVEIHLFDENGNGSICFHFVLANYGIEPLASRNHRFWFTNPQTDLSIEAFDGDEQKLIVEDLISVPTRREIKVHFPNPLQAADQLKYKIQFHVKNGFAGNYYDITARTITKRISFSLYSPQNICFGSHRVEHESADGFTNNSSPLISLALEDGKQKLSWQHRNPKPGDQFRTHWAL